MAIIRTVTTIFGVEEYKKVQELNWNETEKISGKKIKIKGFPRDKKVKMFWIIVISNKNRKLFMLKLSYGKKYLFQSKLK